MNHYPGNMTQFDHDREFDNGTEDCVLAEMCEAAEIDPDSLHLSTISKLEFMNFQAGVEWLEEIRDERAAEHLATRFDEWEDWKCEAKYQQERLK